MRYAYNDIGGLTNGVIFFFEKGDIEIARETFKVINTSKQQSTSILYNGVRLSSQEVLFKLREYSALDDGFLGVRFTVDESQLLREVLKFMKESYPALLSITEEIDNQVFGIPQ